MKRNIFFLILIVGFSCSKLPENNPILVEANKIHLEAVEIQEQVESKIQKLDSLKSTISDGSIIFKIDSSKTLLESWKESLIEVEGFANEHHEGHQHNHKPSPKMTDESMLEYQKNTKRSIDELNNSVEDLIKKIKP